MFLIEFSDAACQLWINTADEEMMKQVIPEAIKNQGLSTILVLQVKTPRTTSIGSHAQTKHHQQHALMVSKVIVLKCIGYRTKMHRVSYQGAKVRGPRCKDIRALVQRHEPLDA